jgi:lysophospholipase L1-like esterase
MTRRFALLALLAAIVQSCGCGRSTHRERSSATTAASAAQDAPHAATIAVLGSSTASGLGLADPSESWVGRYAAHLSSVHGLQVRNLAVPGYTTFHVLPTGTKPAAGRPAVDEAHNVTAALAMRPKAIIVNLPSNDAAMGASVEETMGNLCIVVAKATEAGVPVWVSTSQPRALDQRGRQLLVSLRDRVNQEFAGRALDFWTPLAAPDGAPLPAYNQGDGIHPNAHGHRLLFDQVKLADIPRAFHEIQQDL